MSNNSRLPNNGYAWYGDGDMVDLDFIFPPSGPFPPTLNERVGVDPWLLSLQDRILTLPSSMISFPRPHMQLVVFRDNLASNNNLRTRPTQQHRRQDSELSPEEQSESIKMLKKEIYNPMPKKIIKRLGRFYRQNSMAAKASTGQKNEKKVDEDDGDDYNKCVICLEDFEPKEVVMVTPCNHIFHEDCILPWVKSHGRCPVCRFSFSTNARESRASSTNNDNLVNNQLTNEMIPFVTSRGNSGTNIQPFRF